MRLTGISSAVFCLLLLSCGHKGLDSVIPDKDAKTAGETSKDGTVSNDTNVQPESVEDSASTDNQVEDTQNQDQGTLPDGSICISGKTKCSGNAVLSCNEGKEWVFFKGLRITAGLLSERLLLSKLQQQGMRIKRLRRVMRHMHRRNGLFC
jgi:hypothetical protein